MTEYRVPLRRDTVNTAWGFRLQGGHEYGSPLFVQRVFSGSPADGRLQRGDVFVSINNHDVSRMQLQQAEDIVKAAGSALTLVVKRTGAGTQHEENLLTFANEPQSQPASRGFDNDVQHHQPTPPATVHHGPSSYGGSSHHDRPRVLPTQSKKPNAMVWSPGGGYDQASYRQGQTVDMPSRQHVSAPASASGTQQFSPDADYGPPWQARDGGGGGPWNQSHHPGASTSPQRHQQTQQQQQRGRTQLQPQREYANHAQPAKTPHGVSEESRVVAAQVIKSMNQQDDDDTYEPKSVREIKAMFNKPSRPPVPGQPQRSSNKPWMMQDISAPAPALSPTTTPSWSSPPVDKYPQFPSPTKSFSPPSQPVQERPSILQQHADLIASYPPPRRPHVPATPSYGLIKPSISSSAPKPGAGTSYQGLATVTPAKPVHKHGSAGGSTSTAGKKEKKEFDPSQSLVYQMLQEENEREKRGDGGEPAAEEPNFRRQPPPPPQQQQQQQQQQPARRRPQPQQGSRLQELLERDRAESQQEEDEHMRYRDTRPQPSAALQPQPRQHNQQRMQPPQPQAYHAAPTHQESSYMKGSPSAGYYQQPANTQYEEYYQQSTPTQGYYQSTPYTIGYHSPYAQESMPISEF